VESERRHSGGKARDGPVLPAPAIRRLPRTRTKQAGAAPTEIEGPAECGSLSSASVSVSSRQNRGRRATSILGRSVLVPTREELSKHHRTQQSFLNLNSRISLAFTGVCCCSSTFRTSPTRSFPKRAAQVPRTHPASLVPGCCCHPLAPFSLPVWRAKLRAGPGIDVQK
jgi:hypothetical protein